MAEINFNNIYDQMPGTVKNSYDGVMGGQSFSDQYNPDKRTVNADGTITDTNSQSLTMKDGYSQMVDAYNQEQNIPETGLLSSIGSALNPFSELSASEMPQTYGLQNIINNTQPQNLGFRSMVDMNNDVQNFDNQFVSPDRFNNMAQMGPVKSNMNAPAALDVAKPNVVDPNRIPGRIQEAVEPQYRIRDQLARDFLQGGILKDARKGLGETFGPIVNKIGSGLGSLKDFATNKGTQGFNLARQIPGMALSAMTGIPGIGLLLGGLGNMFEDRQLTGDIEDEYGNMYSADELNSQNALGGYYTDPARSARRRTGRIAKMRARDFNDKKISQTNLDRLVRQEKAQQLRDAKDAADRANIQNVQNYTGRELSGYRMSRPASERNYTGGGPQANDPIGGFENKSGMGRTGYEEGGLASMFTRRR